MAIRFPCKRCHQLLAIASRKAGTPIECPKCGFPQSVPDEQAAESTQSHSAATEAKADEPAGTAIDDEGSRPIGPIPPPPRAQAVPPPPPAPPALVEVARPVPHGMILYPRRTIYLQGFLLLFFVVAAFVAGYLIGRGGADLELPASHQEAKREKVLVDGTLYYETDTGAVAGDAGAVVIMLPAQELPEATLSIQGLRPWERDPPEEARSVRAIEDLGGVYGRADDSGAFRLVLPEEGLYRVLLISRQTARDPQTAIDELDLSEIRKYFYRAEDLIGRSKYRWTTETIRSGFPPVEHNFGRDGQP